MRWPTWQQRRAAARAAFAARIAESGEPRALACMLRRRDPAAVRVATRAQAAAAWIEPGLSADRRRTRRKTQYSAFSVWAPVVLNKVNKSHEAIFDKMP